MQIPILEALEKLQLKTNIPEFIPGDTVRVHIRIKEGEKERLQAFEGVVIGRKGSSVRETITVRKTSSSIGVERTRARAHRTSSRGRARG